MCSASTFTVGVFSTNCCAIFSQTVFSSTEPKNENRILPLAVAAALPGACPAASGPAHAASTPPASAAAPPSTPRRVPRVSAPAIDPFSFLAFHHTPNFRPCRPVYTSKEGKSPCCQFVRQLCRCSAPLSPPP